MTRIEYVASFPENDRFTVWLGTDRQRDQLATEDAMLEEVRAVLTDTGFTPGELTGLRSSVQSQETVDRECGGHWSAWLR